MHGAQIKTSADFIIQANIHSKNRAFPSNVRRFLAFLEKTEPGRKKELCPNRRAV